MLQFSSASRLPAEPMRPALRYLLMPTVWLTAATMGAVTLDVAGAVPDSVLQALALALALRVGYIFLRR